MKLKILFAGDADSVHVVRMADYFSGKGDEVSLVSFRDPLNSRHHTCRVGPRAYRGRLGYLLGFPRFLRVIEEIAPQIVHAHFVTSYGFMSSFASSRPLVVSAWGSDLMVTAMRPFMSVLARRPLSRASLVTADSRELLNLAVDFGARADRSMLLPFGVERALVEGDVASSSSRASLVVSARRVNDRDMNVHLVMEAFANVASARPDAHLWVGGGVPGESLRSAVRERGLESRVGFAGWVERARLHSALAKAAVYVSVPSHDATSVNLLEAMALGACPVVSDIPANREWIADGENGIVVPSLDADAVASALCRALDDADLRRRAFLVNREIIATRAVLEDGFAALRERYVTLL